MTTSKYQSTDRCHDKMDSFTHVYMVSCADLLTDVEILTYPPVTVSLTGLLGPVLLSSK